MTLFKWALTWRGGGFEGGFGGGWEGVAGFVWSGFKSDLFLWVLVWGWQVWFIWVGGWPSSFFCSGRDNPEGVVFEGGKGVGCATHGCVLL